jgi:hypothetical protein
MLGWGLANEVNSRLLNMRMWEAASINWGLCYGQDHPCFTNPENIHQTENHVQSDAVFAWWAVTSVKTDPAVPRMANIQEHGAGGAAHNKCQRRGLKRRQRKMWGGFRWSWSFLHNVTASRWVDLAVTLCVTPIVTIELMRRRIAPGLWRVITAIKTLNKFATPAEAYP